MSISEQSLASVSGENNTEYTLITTPVSFDGQVIQHAIVHHVGSSEQENIHPQGTTQVLMLPIALAADQQGDNQIVQQFQILQEQNLDQLHAQDPQLVHLHSTESFVESLQQVDPQQSLPLGGEYGEIQIQIQSSEDAQVQETNEVIPSKGVSLGRRGRHKGRQEIQPPVGKGPYKCEKCEAVFVKWNQYQRHLRSHDNDKPFPCTECGESFNVEDNLKLHLAIHRTDDPRCPVCDKRFSRMASLKAHLLLHEKEENLICPECGDEYATQGQLDNHLREHIEDEDNAGDMYFCKYCSMEFLKLPQLREHLKQHAKIRHSLSRKSYKRNLDRSTFQYKCTHCSKSFQKPSQLQRHIRIHTGERPYKCSVCDKAFNQKGALNIHMMKHTNARPHHCQFCPQKFSQRGNLRAHIERVHNHSETSTTHVYRCEQCECAFKKLGSLHSHLSRVHLQIAGGNDKSEEASAKAKATLSTLSEVHSAMSQRAVMHQLMELSDQVSQSKGIGVDNDILQQALENSGLPIESLDAAKIKLEGLKDGVADGTADKDSGGGASMETSNAETSQATPFKAGVLSTMAIHDAATGAVKKHTIRRVDGVRWHQCMYCSKEFKKPSDLIRHIRIHTHEKPYKCTQCFRAFAVKSTLTAHLKTHSGIKDYKCHVCQKLFSTQGSLKVHLRLHTGARPFDCPHCDKKFRTSGHSRSHIQSHLREDGAAQKKVRRTIRKTIRPDLDLPDIPLQEPILITDTALIQQPSRSSGVSQYLGETSSVDRPYKCTYCHRGFKKSSHLKQHVRSHTGEKPYKCLQCHKAFVSSGVLKSHIRTHTGIKAYKCHLCNTPFTTNGSLKRHMSTHSEVRPFMCPYCTKRFKTSVNCKKHTKTHKHELAVQALHQQHELGPMDPQSNTMLATEVTVGPDIPEVDDDDDDNDGTVVADREEQNIEISHPEFGDSLIVTGGSGHQQLVSEQQTAALNLHQLQTADPTTVGVGEVLASAGHGELAQQAVIQDALVSDVQMQSALSHQVLGQVDPQPQLQPQQLQPEQPAHSLAQSLLTNASGSAFSQMTLGQLIPISQTGSGMEQSFVEISGLNQSTTNLTSTNMQNILQTKDPDPVVVQIEQPEPEFRVKTPEEPPDPKRSYKCTVCPKSFKKSSHLKQHLRSHLGEKPYECHQCHKFFVSTGVLKSHMKTHLGQKDFTCIMCNAAFTTNGSLSRHMLLHTSDRPFKCPLCPEQFRTALHYKRHLKIHREEQDCDPRTEEPETSEVPKAMRSRQLITITDEQAQELSQTAPTDNMSLSEKILIESAAEKGRVSEIKSKDDPPLAEVKREGYHHCKHCPKAFKKPSDLVRHTRIHTGEKPFVCSICHKAFTVKSTLDSHLRTHEHVEKQFRCHVCMSAFSTRGSLKVHMRLHTGAKPFKCPHCPQKFRTSGHRKSHIQQHFKPAVSRKPKMISSGASGASVQPQHKAPADSMLGVLELDNATVTEVQPQQVPDLMNALQPVSSHEQLNQVVSLDPNMASSQGVLPVSLTFTDIYGQLQSVDQNGMAVQGLDGIQLQLNGYGQGIRITGLDSGDLLNQTIQIDASVLQQLQQQGQQHQGSLGHHEAILVGDSEISQVDTSQQSLVSDMVNPNAVIQSLAPSSLAPTSVVPTSLVDTQALTSDASSFNFSVVVQSPPGVEGNSTEMLPSDVMKVNEAPDEDSMADEVKSVELQVGRETAGGGSSSQMRTDADSDRSHVCEICQKSFKRKGHLKDHLLTHMPRNSGSGRPLPYACTECDKSFSKPSLLERHLRIHTGERPFVCTVCRKAFNQKNTLQIHMRRHSGARPHICLYCDASFSQKGNLKTHIKRYHHWEMRRMMEKTNSAGGAKEMLEDEEQEEEQGEVSQATEALKSADASAEPPAPTGTTLDLSDVLHSF